MNSLCGPKAYADEVANKGPWPSWKWRHGNVASSQKQYWLGH